MSTIKKHKNLVILALVIIGLAFYWYEWRPVQIKKECWAKTKEAIEQSSNKSASDVETFLNVCLTSRGI